MFFLWISRISNLKRILYGNDFFLMSQFGLDFSQLDHTQKNVRSHATRKNVHFIYFCKSSIRITYLLKNVSI